MAHRTRRLGIFALFTAFLGCSSESPDRPQLGELSMRLRSEVNGVSYRLRDGVFAIGGPEIVTLDTETDPDAATIVQTLESGDYNIELLSGWRLEKEFPSGFQTVSAELVTPNPLDFTITNDQTTVVSYGFRTDGVIVGMGQGDLNIDLQVEDTSNPPDELAIVGNLDGRLIQTPCADNPSTDDCNIRGIVDQQFVPCQGGRLDIVLDHPIAGTPGAQYAATLHFYGVVDPKNYGNTGTREAGRVRPQNLNSGAEPPPWHIGVPGQNFLSSTYSSYEIHVFDQNDQEVGVYYVNSDTQEGHYTYVLNFERTIPIVGGGRVRVRMFDNNCRQIKNCGATSGAPCSPKARTVDISAADPQPELGLPPAGFDQPGLGQSSEHAGQWFLIDVTNVQPM